MNPRMSAQEHGCSLAEALVALSILSTVMMGSVGMLTLAQKGLAGGGKGLELAASAESRLEAFRAIPYLTLLMPDFNGDGETDLVLQDGGGGEFVGRQTVRGTELVWTVIPNSPDLASSSATTVTVSADWVDQQGRRKSFSWGLRRANPVFNGEPS